MPPPFDFVVVGGGAAGFFAAIAFAEANPRRRVLILERGNEVLQKVRISGGGRCNVTHACFEARDIVKFYPRGEKALVSTFSRFGAHDTVEWFRRHGVALKTEPDGRMFPTTDRSETIAHCLLDTAAQLGIVVRTATRVESLMPPAESGAAGVAGCWAVVTPADTLYSKAVMVAAGSSAGVWEMLRGLGYRIEPPVPSLFTFNIPNDARLHELAGVAVPKARLSIALAAVANGTAKPKTVKLATEGALLITHWGLSAPSVLKLSAWGARVLHDAAYRFTVYVDWTGTGIRVDEMLAQLNTHKATDGKRSIAAHPLYALPSRLWQRLVWAAGIDEAMRWADAPKTQLQALATELVAAPFAVVGKSTFKEEFVTCGGVALSEIDFRTMESKRHAGLYFAGEIVDIDALTGGFNFQAAWSCGWIAGNAVRV